MLKPCHEYRPSLFRPDRARAPLENVPRMVKATRKHGTAQLFPTGELREYLTEGVICVRHGEARASRGGEG